MRSMVEGPNLVAGIERWARRTITFGSPGNFAVRCRRPKCFFGNNFGNGPEGSASDVSFH
jgi:hypothetical protein